MSVYGESCGCYHVWCAWDGEANGTLRRQKSEENLALTETELDKQTGLVADLTRRVDELQVAADEAVKLKDQMDEYGAPMHCDIFVTNIH